MKSSSEALPKKTVYVPKNDAAKGVRWRSAEERREAKRKIDAIRRETERIRLERGPTIDASIFRSPKVIGGILVILLALGMFTMSAFHKAPTAAASQRIPLEQNRARRSLKVLGQAFALYRIHTNSWPSQRLGLFTLAKNYEVPGWKGPYINWAYKDPWGNPYVYRMPISPFEAPELFSCGPDGKPDTADDLRLQPEDFTCSEGTWRRDATEAADATEAETPPSPTPNQEIHE